MGTFIRSSMAIGVSHRVGSGIVFLVATHGLGNSITRSDFPNFSRKNNRELIDMQNDKLKKLVPVVIGLVAILISPSLSAGRGGIRQDTRIEAAQTFVQALIEGDDSAMDRVNRSGPLMHPTFDLMAHVAPRYAGRSLQDFTFTEIGNVVRIESKDGKILTGLEIVRIGDKYFFVNFRRQR